MRWLLSAGMLLSLALPAKAFACEQVEPIWYNPTGWQGCEQWGTGTASTWQGPSAASNDCLYPWTDCAARIVTSLDTGLSIHVVPRMFCGCFVNGTGPNGETERLIDLTRGQVAALGLDAADGLFDVVVTPIEQPEQGETLGASLAAGSMTPAPVSLPDTATLLP